MKDESETVDASNGLKRFTDISSASHGIPSKRIRDTETVNVIRLISSEFMRHLHQSDKVKKLWENVKPSCCTHFEQ